MLQKIRSFHSKNNECINFTPNVEWDDQNSKETESVILKKKKKIL